MFNHCPHPIPLNWSMEFFSIVRLIGVTLSNKHHTGGPVRCEPGGAWLAARGGAGAGVHVAAAPRGSGGGAQHQGEWSVA